MKNRTKGVIAGIAGLALLSGGTTFALWQDNTNVTGGTITNGDLAVAATPITWVDNSADRPSHPTVDLTTWKMVPGDTLVGTTTITTTLDGANLAATLAVDTTAATLPQGMAVSYVVKDSSDATVGGGNLGTDTSLRVVNGGTYAVTITATFDPATSDKGSVGATTALSDVNVSLTQVRTGAGFTS